MEHQLERRGGGWGGWGEIEVNLTLAIVNPELSWTICQSGGNGVSGSESSLESEANEVSGTGEGPVKFIFPFRGKCCFQGPRQPSCG